MQTAGAARYLAGLDVGGTFTDLTVYDRASGRTLAFKVPSNRRAPDEAVLAALDKSAIPREDIALIVHGTTVATNALLERRGANAAMITTEGFRDVIELGRTTRLVPNSLYDPYFQRPEALIPRRHRRVVAERVEADGRVSTPLDTHELARIARALKDEGIETVVVGFINSYRNDAHERAAVEVLRESFEFVTRSSDVLNEMREFERFSAGAINAYVMPTMASYVQRLTGAVRERNPATSFYTMASHGGLMSSDLVCAHPVRTILSGPAAGVAAAVHLSRATGVENLITYDMGGTSTDVAMVSGGRFPLRHETLLDGMVIRLPQLDIETIGAGGGSIASVDAGGGLHVGPTSAGAVPGPACYGRGGTLPTVTDANVVLGRLGDAQELGGSLKIDRKAAVAALAPMAAIAGISVESMAEGVVRLAVAKMASAVYEVSVARGYDPREFSLLCYGGAGPLHACLVADEVGIPQVIVPPMPGAFSAFGALCSTLTKDRVATVLAQLDAESLSRATKIAEGFEVAMREEFAREGVAIERYLTEWQLDMRYVGQAHEITVHIPAHAALADVAEAFERDFEREYGRRDKNRALQLVNVRVLGRVPIDAPRFGAASANAKAAPATTRVVTVGGETRDCPVWRREDIAAGTVIDGPAVIEEMSATTWLPPSWQVRVGTIGELVAQRV
jgi:N-methylhydantoinase A